MFADRVCCSRISSLLQPYRESVAAKNNICRYCLLPQYIESVAAIYIVSCSHNNICRQGLLQPYLESVAAICKVCCSNTYSLLQPKHLHVLSFVYKYQFLTLYMAARDSIYGCNRLYQPKHLQQTLPASSIHDCNGPLLWLQQT